MQNRPEHYDNGIEAIDVIESNGLGFHLGNAVKYILRAGKKIGQDAESDLGKAIWYIGREITAQNQPVHTGLGCVSAKLLAVDGKMLPGIELPPAPQFTGTQGEKLLEYAGRICYDSFGKPGSRPTAAYLDHIVESRHTSILGHAVLHFSASEYELKKFVWMFRSEPGWYIDHANTLTINLRLLERKKPYFYEFYPEVWNAFHEAYPLVITHRCQKVMEPRLFLYEKPGKHQWVTFHITCSRSCSHEWVRHSFQSAISQRSTRYVEEGDYKLSLHPLFSSLPDLSRKFRRDAEMFASQSKQLYEGVVKKGEKILLARGFEKSKARKMARGAAARFLPHGLPTQFVYSASLYEWDNIFEQRISVEADSEIRELAAICMDGIQRIVQ